MERVFISYSKLNRDTSERLARDLNDAGLEVWIDFRSISAGEEWREAIVEGIKQCDLFVVGLSPDAVNSEWVRREIFLATTMHKIIIPVMFVSCLDEMERFDETRHLLNIQIINFHENYEKTFPLLLQSLPGMKRRTKTAITETAEVISPFKSLEAFQQTDADIFFGRDDLIERMLGHFRPGRFGNLSSRFLAVVGASGSGKSSLVRAGFIPAIRGGKLPGSDEWPVVIITPGPRPIESLATRLVPMLGGSRVVNEVVNLLGYGSESLHQISESILAAASPQARLVLIVDQFEEVFTRASETERERFLDMLYQAVTIEDGKTIILITMRADFFNYLSAYPHLARLFEGENMMIATEMTPDNLRRCIEGPAAAVGLVYEDGLADRILNDVWQQPGSLPLLQHALYELYLRRDRRRLTHVAYETIGGVKMALAHHAEDFYSALDEPQREVMRRVLLRLVEVTDSGEATRRKVARDELTFQGVPSAILEEVIEALTSKQSRLLTVSRNISSSQGESEVPTIWLEISHEALIRHWERFTTWIVEDVEQLRYGSELLKAAYDWQKAGLDSAYLLVDTRLSRANEWLETADASDLQRRFIEASQYQHEQRLQHDQEMLQERLALQEQQLVLQQDKIVLQDNLAQKQAANVRRLRLFGGVLLILAVAAVFFAFEANNQRVEANSQRVEAEQERSNAQLESQKNATLVEEQKHIILSSQLAAQASSFSSSEPDLAFLLGIEAYRTADTPASTSTLLDMLVQKAGLVSFLHGSDNSATSFQRVTFSPDGKFVAAASTREIVVWDAQTHKMIASRSIFSDYVGGLIFIPDNQRLAIFSCFTSLTTGEESQCLNGDLEMWNFETNTPLWNKYSDIGTFESQLILNPDGETLALTGCNKRNEQNQCTEGKVEFWNSANGEKAHEPLVNKDASITALAFVPGQNNQLVTVGTDGSFLTWDVARTKAIIKSPPSDSNNVSSMVFSPNGQIIATTGNDDTIRLVESKTLLAVTSPRARISDLDESSGVSQEPFPVESPPIFWVFSSAMKALSSGSRSIMRARCWLPLAMTVKSSFGTCRMVLRR